MTLDELIAQTRSQAGSVEPLPLLATAAQCQQELADLGEQLLDHFVQEARSAGCSWSQIGTALGVSKQAAQQRHSDLRSLVSRIKGAVQSSFEGLFARFTSPARHVVVLAQEEAQRLRHHHIGTEHLLLGLLVQRDGIGAQALRQAGVTLDTARSAVERITERGEKTPSRRIPFTPRAKKTLELGLREALQLGHHYIGTEHILLGLLTEGEGVAIQVLASAGVQPADLRDTVLYLLEPEAPSGTE